MVTDEQDSLSQAACFTAMTPFTRCSSGLINDGETTAQRGGRTARKPGSWPQRGFRVSVGSACAVVTASFSTRQAHTRRLGPCGCRASTAGLVGVGQDSAFLARSPVKPLLLRHVRPEQRAVHWALGPHCLASPPSS